MHQLTDFLFGKKALKKASEQGTSAPSATADQSYDYVKSQIAAGKQFSEAQRKSAGGLPAANQPTRKQLGAPAKDPATAELASPRTRRKK